MMPCDVLILDGKVIVNESLLTGESTPQMKDSIATLSDDVNLDMKLHKRNIIFGGTKVLLSESGDKFKPPNNGCVGIVLRTGFETSQGKLIRTILFSSERVTANNAEALLFILILLIFAIISSGYVLYNGLIHQNRKLFKLLLNCVMIITSVVPPELPFELSLAVNNSLLYLSQLGIFCTEPFRIPFAGKVDYCCFDKTGTLTTDKMILKGIHNDETKFAKVILSGCNSLIHIDGQTVGDPMEVAALNGSDFSLNKDFTIVNNVSRKKYKIVKRFPFSSELKRMSTILNTDKGYVGLIKGAPEMLKDMFEKIPKDYDETYKSFMNNGFRVIALGHKNVSNDRITREELEKDLVFSGFAIFQSDIKQDTFSTIQNLLSSNHSCIMITGDNVLTGAHVGKELNFIDKPIIVLTKKDDTCEWVSQLDEKRFSMDSTEVKKEYSLCVSGDALSIAMLKDSKWLEKWVRDVKIFARVDPDQKELILVTLKKLGHSTLMCGDGTNDTGALKQADIGVALLDGITEQDWEKMSKKPKPIIDMKKKSISDVMQEESNVVKLGDASIASPFTSKKSSILSTSHIIRQGRCTLVTTIQMYKILAINSLISAYSLSVLYMEGVKFGDYQMMISGMFVAVLFLFISRSKPLDVLSSERPDNSIFSPWVLISILFQSILNIFVLVYSSQSIKLLMEKPLDPDSEFVPSSFNTVVFLVTTIQTLLTFINNYKGHPFLQSITENRGLFAVLSAHSVLLTLLLTEASPKFNEYFQLSPLGDFKFFLIKLIAFNVVVSLIFEWCLKKIRKIMGK